MSGVGVQWIAENLRRCSLFDETPRIHDAEAVSHMRVDAHVMGDEQDRRANLALNAANHTEHLLLHQDIERGRGFVGDNEIRATDRGERKRGALTHAAGQLMGVGFQHRRGKFDPRQMGDDLLLELLPAAADVRIREIDESRSKPAKRIQDIHRALHDIGKVPPADPRHLSRWSAVHSAVAGQESEIHAAANDLHWRPDRAYDTLSSVVLPELNSPASPYISPR